MTKLIEKPIEAWLVRVNLHALAANLTRRYARSIDEIDAAIWLCKSEPAPTYAKAKKYESQYDHSPFTFTSESGVFYSDEEPTQHLIDGEIIDIRTVKPRKRNMQGRLFKPTFEAEFVCV